MPGVDVTQVELGGLLGKGGEGVVYLGRLGDAQVAVKIIAPVSQAGADQILARLSRFARAGGNGVVAPILAYGTLGDAPTRFARQLPSLSRDSIYILMAFLPYGTLADLPRPLPGRQAASLLWLTADALVGLPVAVFHGDVRASNVALRPDGVTLLDPDLTLEPSAEDDLRGLGKLIAELAPSFDGPDRVNLDHLASELAGQPPLPKLSEVQARLRTLATHVGARPEDVGAAQRPAAVTAPRPVNPPPRRRWRWIAGATCALLLVVFGPYIVMNSPLRPAPTGHLVTNSDIVSTQDGLYDTTGTVDHNGSLYPLKCGEKVDGRRGFIQITIAEPVKRIAILRDPGDGQVPEGDSRHALWELTDPPLHQVYCFDVPDQKYIVEQDRLLADGQPQIDPKSFRINLHHPLRLKTTEHMMYAPAPGPTKSLWQLWWDGFE